MYKVFMQIMGENVLLPAIHTTVTHNLDTFMMKTNLSREHHAVPRKGATQHVRTVEPES